MKVLPIGSVVKARGVKLLLTGYTIYDDEKEMQAGYFAVKYPRGYAGEQSLGVLLFSEEMEVLFEGYQTMEETAFTEALGEFWVQAKEYPVSEWNSFFALLEDILGRGAERR